MPRIAVKNLDKLKQHPREFSLLYELGGTAEGIDSQVTTYGRWPKAQPASLDTRLAGCAGSDLLLLLQQQYHSIWHALVQSMTRILSDAHPACSCRPQ
jgi:hypothetical protein